MRSLMAVSSLWRGDGIGEKPVRAGDGTPELTVRYRVLVRRFERFAGPVTRERWSSTPK